MYQGFYLSKDHEGKSNLNLNKAYSPFHKFSSPKTSQKADCEIFLYIEESVISQR